MALAPELDLFTKPRIVVHDEEGKGEIAGELRGER
jgi:hypothetical protein